MFDLAARRLYLCVGVRDDMATFPPGGVARGRRRRPAARKVRPPSDATRAGSPDGAHLSRLRRSLHHERLARTRARSPAPTACTSARTTRASLTAARSSGARRSSGSPRTRRTSSTPRSPRTRRTSAPVPSSRRPPSPVAPAPGSTTPSSARHVAPDPSLSPAGSRCTTSPALVDGGAAPLRRRARPHRGARSRAPRRARCARALDEALSAVAVEPT